MKKSNRAAINVYLGAISVTTGWMTTNPTKTEKANYIL